MSKRFSEQFKHEAVQLVSAERPISEVASQLGVGYSTLDKWVRTHRKSTGQLVTLDFTRFNRHLLRSKLNWSDSYEESEIPSGIQS